MFDFLIATGKFGVLGVCLVFVVVFILSEPGKEISFWGVKFHKKYRFKTKFNWRRVPKPLPEDWKIVLLVFALCDEHYLPEDLLFEHAKRLAGYSELEIRNTCVEMEKYGLVRHSANYVSIQNRALTLASQIFVSDEGKKILQSAV